MEKNVSAPWPETAKKVSAPCFKVIKKKCSPHGLFHRPLAPNKFCPVPYRRWNTIIPISYKYNWILQFEKMQRRHLTINESVKMDSYEYDRLGFFDKLLWALELGSWIAQDPMMSSFLEFKRISCSFVYVSGRIFVVLMFFLFTAMEKSYAGRCFCFSAALPNRHVLTLNVSIILGSLYNFNATEPISGK